MTKEEALEGMKRHTEAILNLAKEIGVSDYVNIAIISGKINLNNNALTDHVDDGLGFDFIYSGGEWTDILQIVTGCRSND